MQRVQSIEGNYFLKEEERPPKRKLAPRMKRGRMLFFPIVKGGAAAARWYFDGNFVSPSPAQAQTICQVGPATGNDIAQIQQAIDNCAGGGEVRLTAGEVYTAGAIELRSGVTFNLNNATLQASGNAVDFHWHSFVTARRFSGDSNITIIGPGTINKTPGNAVGQVHLVWFEGNNNFTIQNITVDSTMAQTHNAANGNHIRINGGRDILIEDVVVRGTKVNAYWHTDGIALAKVTNGIVRRCDIVTTDDALWAGSGSSNILFEDCKVSSGATALEIDTSPSSEPGGANLSDITFRRMYVYDSGWSISDGGGIVFKFQDVGLVKNVVFEDITIGPNVTHWIYAQRSRAVDNNNSILQELCLKNVMVESGIAGAKVMGDNDTRVKDMIFSDILFTTGSSPFVNFVSINGLQMANAGQKSDYSFAGDVYNVQVIPDSLTCSGGTSPPPPSPPPTCDITVTKDTLQLFEAQATDPEGDSVYYTFSWGDGSLPTRVPASGFVSSGTAQSTAHAFTALGTFTVTVTATDVNNNTSPSSDPLTVCVN